MEYIKYNNTSGEIVANGSSTSDVIPLTEEQGFIIMEGIGNTFQNYVKDGEIIAYTPEQQAAKMQRPFYPAHWSNETFSWIADT